jgi:hypothetical protein
MNRVGQNRIHTPYITVSLENFLPKVPIYTVYMWFWPALDMKRDAARHSTTQHDTARRPCIVPAWPLPPARSPSPPHIQRHCPQNHCTDTHIHARKGQKCVEVITHGEVHMVRLLHKVVPVWAYCCSIRYNIPWMLHMTRKWYTSKNRAVRLHDYTVRYKFIRYHVVQRYVGLV